MLEGPDAALPCLKASSPKEFEDSTELCGVSEVLGRPDTALP